LPEHGRENEKIRGVKNASRAKRRKLCRITDGVDANKIFYASRYETFFWGYWFGYIAVKGKYKWGRIT
jgi:hypothetical protein